MRVRTRLAGSRHRRAATIGISILLALGVLSARPALAGAAVEQGTIAVHSLATLNPYPCNSATPCTTSSLSATSAGYLAGINGGQPYVFAWSAPSGGVSNMQYSITYDDICGGGWPLPSGGQIGGTYQINGVDGYEGGVQTNAIIVGTWSAARDDTQLNVARVGLLTATIKIGATSIPITIDNAAGVLIMTPTSNDLCSTGKTSQQFSIDGTLLTAL
jgi:hypothetical protein